MTHRVRRISVFQTAKVGAVIYGAIGLIAMPILLITALVSSEGRAAWLGFAFFSPVIYACVGFIGVAITCLVYNAAAALVGGVHLDLEPLAPPVAATPAPAMSGEPVA